MSEIQASLYSNPYGRPDRLVRFLKELSDNYAEVNQLPKKKWTYDWGPYDLKDFALKEGTEWAAEGYYMARLHNQPPVRMPRRK